MIRPTLQQLSYLVALHDHQQFGRAAEASFVSQPALSTQIQELERRLGSILVERSAKRVLFTPTGEAVVARARLVLTAVDELVRAAQEDGPLSGPVRLGVIPTMAPYLLPPVVADLVETYPDVTLGLKELRTGELLAAVREGALDLGLLAGPVDVPELHVEHLADDAFVLATSTRSPRRKARLRLDDLERESVLLLDEGHCLREQAMAVCALAGAPTVDVRATSLGTLTQMVAADLGVTLLPASALGIEAREGNGIVVQRFASPEPKRSIVLAWRRSSPRHAAYLQVAERLRPLLRAAVKLPAVLR